MKGYNFAYLDEQTKRMIRRAILKAVAVPGYQVPFASREMPLPYGWGTGGIQVTASIIGRSDTLKVIDQGADVILQATGSAAPVQVANERHVLAFGQDSDMIKAGQVQEGAYSQNNNRNATSEARNSKSTPPVDAAIIGIVDTVDVAAGD